MSLRIWKAKTELHKLTFGVKLLNCWKPKFLILKKSCENVKYQQNVNTKVDLMNKLHVRINWSWRFLQIPITTFFLQKLLTDEIASRKNGKFTNWLCKLENNAPGSLFLQSWKFSKGKIFLKQNKLFQGILKGDP